MDCAGKYYYLDGVIMPSAGNGDFPSGDVSFYEVIRTRKGIPLFFDDHMRRLQAGIHTRYELREDIVAGVREGFNDLVSIDPYEEINIRVTVTFTGRDYSLHICYIPSFYPTVTMVTEGVPLILYHAERLDPAVKMLNNRLRLSVNEELSKRNAYEALLVNADGYITEGSRSNIFFITRDGIIHTAPDKMVLSGITRKYVTGILRELGIGIVYGAVRENEIKMFRSAFITGTSPMVLAVRTIEGQQFDASDPVVGKIREIYSGLAERSISDYILRNKED
jgi:branched-chain amino acid aminotransferase